MDSKRKPEELLFDSETYNKQYYADADCYTDTAAQYELYASGLLKGETFIDVGTGPNLLTAVPAGKHFQSIVLTDYNPAHLEYLRKWKNGEGDAHFWDPYFQKGAEIHGEKDNWIAYKEELRKKIKAIKFCDIRQKNPLHPESLEQFDVVSCSQTLECASATLTEYKQNVKNLSNLIKPGGKAVIVGELMGTYFTVGEEKYPMLTTNEEFVKEAFTSAGLKTNRWDYFEYENVECNGDNAPSCFIMVTSKPV